jgi:transcription termination factor NusB
VNEAIELAKRFSDDQGKGFINGALSTFLKEKEAIILAAKEGEYRVFSV